MIELDCTGTAGAREDCTHHTGWFMWAKWDFWLFELKKEYYVCSLCGESMLAKDRRVDSQTNKGEK